MKNREQDAPVKRPSSCDDPRCRKLPRVDQEEPMDAQDQDDARPPDLPDSSSRDAAAPPSPVDLSSDATNMAPLSETNNDLASDLTRPVLKIPTSMKCLATFDLPGKADLHQLLTNNLAQHLAVQNERLKNNLLFSHNHTHHHHNGLLRPPPPVQPPGGHAPPLPHLDTSPRPREEQQQNPALPFSAGQSHADNHNHNNNNRTVSDEDVVVDRRKVDENDGGGGGGGGGEGNTAPRVTPFSVMDILDPRKFTGRTHEDDLPDSSSDRQDEDDAYISGG